MNKLATPEKKTRRRIIFNLSLLIVLLFIAALGLLAYRALYIDYKKAEDRLLNMVFESDSKAIAQKYSLYGKGYYDSDYIQRDIERFRKDNGFYAVYLTSSKKLVIAGEQNLKRGFLIEPPLFIRIKPILNDQGVDAPQAYIVGIYYSQVLMDLRNSAIYVLVMFIILAALISYTLARWLQAKDEGAAKEQMMIEQSRFAEMGSMLSNIAHQWKQPLSSIGSAVILIDYNSIRYCRTDEEIEEILEQTNMIRGQLKYLSSTIDTFKNFLQTKPTNITVFSLSSVLDDISVLLEYELRSNDVKIVRLNIVDQELYGCKDQLLQALLIIFQNAIDALKSRDKRSRQISVESNLVKGIVTLYIRDNGPGIDEANLRHIFDAYFTTKHKDRGTGLGLYIAKTIIEFKFLGALIARNHASGGAEFVITLPPHSRMHPKNQAGYRPQVSK